MLGIDLHTVLSKPVQPGIPGHQRRCRIVDRDIVEKDPTLGPLVVAPDPRSTRRPVDHHGDAVELFMARMKDMA